MGWIADAAGEALSSTFNRESSRTHELSFHSPEKGVSPGGEGRRSQEADMFARNREVWGPV